MAQTPVIIVGAGLGGLTLAQQLRQRNISSIILDKRAILPKYTYGITLRDWAYLPLFKHLQMGGNEIRKLLAVDAGKGGLGLCFHNPRITPIGYPLRASRAKLESFLRQGLNIKLDHSLKDITITDEGVQLAFESHHQSLISKFVVMADGIHSSARASLFPNSKVSVLPYVALNGKRRIKRAIYEQSYAGVFAEHTMIQHQVGDVLLEISMAEFTNDVVNLSYTFSRKAREHDQLYVPDRHTSQATEIPEAFYEELKQLSDLDEPFADMFDAEQVRKDRVLNWLMRFSMVPLDELQALGRQGVVFIGDSVHGQPILGGLGANSAMKSGFDLAELIIDGRKSITEFYEENYGEWLDKIEESKKELARMHEPKEGNGQTRSAL